MRRFIAIILILIFMILLWIINDPIDEGVAILEYHTVTDTPDIDSERYNVRPDDFKAQLDYLAAKGYNTITTSEFINAKQNDLKLPDKTIILTFDDGYEDNYLYMLPILEAHNMKAVVYIIANELGKPGYLTVEQVRDMQNRGIEIGCHTANHRPLIGLNKDELSHEIRDSKLYLEYLGINNVFSFSYPNGLYNDEIISEIKRNHYLTSVTGDPGFNDFSTNPYLLQRINIPDPKLGILEFRLRLLKGKIFTKLGIKQHRIQKNDKSEGN